MNGNTIGAVIVVIIVVIGGWYLLSKPAQAPITEQTPAVTNTTATATTTETAVATTTTPLPAMTIAYTNQGFSPKSVSVTLGTTVNFVNQSSKEMWVASAKHPDHTVYSDTSLSQHCPDTTNSSFDECTSVTAGGSFTFTFNKVGTWKYHNHTNASDFGSVTVTALATTTTPNPI